jgi:hypothetical protein
VITESIRDLALTLLRVLLPAPYREPVLGDLAEEYAIRARSGPALSWLAGQICRSVPALLGMAVRRDSWLGTIGIGLAAWVAASMLESIAVAAASQWLGGRGLLVAVLSTLLGILSMAGGGYIAARFRRGAAIVMAALVFVVVVALMLTASQTYPLWHQLTLLLIGPLAPLLGGALAGDRQLRPRS